MSNFPLLSQKPLSLWTPEEYLTYIKTLYQEPAARKVPKVRLKKHKPPPSLKVRRLKSGKLSLVSKRKPLWLTELEHAELLVAGISQRELFNLLREKGAIVLANEEMGRRYAQAATEAEEPQ